MKPKKSDAPSRPARPAKTPRHAAPQSHEVRLIGGQWKRTKLKVFDKPGLRPTPDRVRETLFNWLGQDLSGWRCIDVFAGTGALGFEAASRGATEVRLVEQDTALVDQLKRIQTQLQASMTQIVRGDGVTALKQLDAGSMDAIFLDPPFDLAATHAVVASSPAKPFAAAAVVKTPSASSVPAKFMSALFDAALLAAGRAVALTGFVYLEAPVKWTDVQLAVAGLVLHRHLKAGAVHAHLLKRADAPQVA
jgi:16S rRNA (guanine966-N2)-methyltransferase